MQEMQGMPSEVSATVPVDDDFFSPEINVGAAASADQAPRAAPGVAQLSQGQLKKLKQRRAAERKREALHFICGIVDEILADASFLGETAIVERRIETCEGDLKRGLITAVERLKLSAECLTSDIIREVAQTILSMIDDFAEQLPDLLLDDILDTVLNRASNEEVLRREAAAHGDSSLGSVLFLAANPELQTCSQTTDCAVCFAEICLLDPSVMTVMCCDGRWVLCATCLERVRTSPPHVRVGDRDAGHRFQESPTFHLQEWADRMRRVLYRR